jgi:hypothetical protein
LPDFAVIDEVPGHHAEADEVHGAADEAHPVHGRMAMTVSTKLG